MVLIYIISTRGFLLISNHSVLEAQRNVYLSSPIQIDTSSVWSITVNNDDWHYRKRNSFDNAIISIVFEDKKSMKFDSILSYSSFRFLLSVSNSTGDDLLVSWHRSPQGEAKKIKKFQAYNNYNDICSPYKHNVPICTFVNESTKPINISLKVLKGDTVLNSLNPRVQVYSEDASRDITQYEFYKLLLIILFFTLIALSIVILIKLLNSRK